MSGKYIFIGAFILIAGLAIINYAVNPPAGNPGVPGGHGATAAPSVATSPGSTQDSTQTNFAPDFTLQDLKTGKTISLASYRGEKPVILAFWASWCPNCQRNMPKLNGFYQQYSDEIEILGINLREKQALAERFVDSKGITFPNAIDAGSVASAYNIRYTNTHFLVNKEGEIIKMVSGDVSENDIKLLLQ